MEDKSFLDKNLTEVGKDIWNGISWCGKKIGKAGVFFTKGVKKGYELSGKGFKLTGKAGKKVSLKIISRPSLRLILGASIGLAGIYSYKNLTGKLDPDYNPNYPATVIERRLDAEEYAVVKQRNKDLTEFLIPGKGKAGKCRKLDDIEKEEIERETQEYKTQIETLDQEYESKRQIITNKYGVEE